MSEQQVKPDSPEDSKRKFLKGLRRKRNSEPQPEVPTTAEEVTQGDIERLRSTDPYVFYASKDSAPLRPVVRSGGHVEDDWQTRFEDGKVIAEKQLLDAQGQPEPATKKYTVARWLEMQQQIKDYEVALKEHGELHKMLTALPNLQWHQNPEGVLDGVNNVTVISPRGETVADCSGIFVKGKIQIFPPESRTDDTLERFDYSFDEFTAMQQYLQQEAYRPTVEALAEGHFGHRHTTLPEILSDQADRNNQLTIQKNASTNYRDFYGDVPPQPVSERQALINLQEFLDIAKQTAHEFPNSIPKPEWYDVQPDEVLKKVQALETQLCYMGEPEFQAAIEGMAGYWHDLAQSGRDVYLYYRASSGGRSEKYVIDRAVKKLQEKFPDDEANKRIQVVGNENAIADAVSRKYAWDKGYRIIFVDDYPISNNQFKEKTLQVFRRLYNHTNMQPQDFAEVFEANFMAVAGDSQDFKTTVNERLENEPGASLMHSVGDDIEFSIKTKGYFKLENESGWPLVTSSHSSADYGFESPLGRIQSFLKKHGRAYHKFLPISLQRPYK